jgi:hypothetical protein
VKLETVTTALPEWLDQLIADPDREAATISLGARFLRATAAERAALHDGWSSDAQWPYPAPSRLACTTNERFPPRDRIVSSIVLESLESVFGTREHLISLCATYRSGELAGISPAELFEAVGALLPDAHAQQLSAFLLRSPEQRATSAFGLVEKANADGEVEVHLLPQVPTESESG